MLYRTYGTTGKSCSVLGFGGMRFGDIDDRDACVAAIVARRAGRRELLRHRARPTSA